MHLGNYFTDFNDYNILKNISNQTHKESTSYGYRLHFMRNKGLWILYLARTHYEN